ncbi:hypothetical protein [Vibrio breoganii]|uniref:capsular polysaccharide export protein, LipB/KpsS family n=1 Tax=Vibrio breoganii TaxID=553239 RepID=UPI000C81BB0E|nr:hypothetical protein [Vibrio breoganii]PMM19796.1 hypothetical protein BCT59_08355 [Vibrio breoganii]
MKIMFVENKYKTLFWDKIAEYLIAEGHEIHWIIQNKLYTPSKGQRHLIKLPTKEELRYDPSYKELELKDRYSYVYGFKPLHYNYYQQKIESILMLVKPDIVFGESTLFHELLTIEVCKKKNILYLHPSTCRYPTNRFSFYQFDSLVPYGGSNEIWNDKVIEKVIKSIINRNSSPDYMKKEQSIGKLSFYMRRMKGLFGSLISSNFLGEVYNTPTVSSKFRIEQDTKKNRNAYERIAIRNIDSFKKGNTIIFPLQMQPESNLDVWGAPFNVQSDIISQIADSLGEKWSILIKPNPKSKYEISQALLDEIDAHPHVHALCHDISMDVLFEKFDCFFSVTGTINIECILAGKYCFSPKLPVNTMFTPELNCFPSLNAMNALRTDRDKMSPYALINYLVSSSFSGMIGDQIHAPQVFSDSNIYNVVNAFKEIIRKKSSEV